MTATASFQKLYALDEFLAFEEKALEKHEFDNGKLKSMAGGTNEHAKIAMNFGIFLNNALLEIGKDLPILGSDIKIFLPLLSKTVYPDLVCIDGEEEHFDEKRTLLINPTLVVEVLSESTAEYDRTEKFEKYCTLPSFQEYVLISQNRPRVEVFFLHDPENGLWKITRASGLEASILLRSVGCEMQLKDIYRGIRFV